MNPLEKNALAPRETAPGAPVFDEPWQAQTLALAYALAERGVFTHAQWSHALGAELREAQTRGEPDDQAAYYAAALAALEELLSGSGAVPAGDLEDCTETWRRAYLNTPHGEPVELEAGRKS